MWLNPALTSESAIAGYRQALAASAPKHLVIDGLFNDEKLRQVCRILQQPTAWQTQKHTYAALYVSEMKWQITPKSQRFVQRDLWLRSKADPHVAALALEFLAFLRGHEFLALLTELFSVPITDIHLDDPERNTNYFRLGARDFINQHADDSPGREICLLLYLNENWQAEQGGELVFAGTSAQPIAIAPLFNRCVLFDPSAEGTEHWVQPVNDTSLGLQRYNVTSWYWGE
jgi:Rps23 Pro-64 3,4-dihydroxylase Tpa1-like proline 4-hydroxylase